MGWGVGDYLKYSIAVKKMFCGVSKMMERFEKKQYGLKMFMSMGYLSILHEKNTLRVSRNQPSLPF